MGSYDDHLSDYNDKSLLNTFLSNNGEIWNTSCNSKEWKAIIRILVAYTPKLLSETPSASNDGNSTPTDGMNTLIQKAIDIANEGYENSNILARLELAYSYKVEYTEEYTSLDLNRFRDNNDEYMDEVHDLRNDFFADVSVLLGYNIKSLNNSNGELWATCGISTVNATENEAFSIVRWGWGRWRDCIENYTFSHEIGHIIWARHSINQDDRTDRAFPYTHWYCNPNTNNWHWQTIMAYTCPENTGWRRINYWSDPYSSYPEEDGDVMWVVEESNNTRLLNWRASVVASFRGCPIPIPTVSELFIPTVSGLLGRKTLEICDIIPNHRSCLNFCVLFSPNTCVTKPVKINICESLPYLCRLLRKLK